MCKTALQNKNKAKNVCRIGANTIERMRTYFNTQDIQINDFICCTCRTKANKKNNIPLNISKSSEEFDNNDEASINGINESPLIKTFNELDNSNDKDDQNDAATMMEHEVRRQVELYKACSTHKHCLMCKSKNGLHKIKPESIIFAYKYYGTIIKQDSYCCNRHFLRNGEIKHEDFIKISRQKHFFDKDAIRVLDFSFMNEEKLQIQITETCGVFDKFKNLSSLEEDLCKKITGWTKNELVRFSNYIKNIRDSAGRTKEQLIAIYRYWLKKGLDQTTLAMLKSNTTQQQISHYLSQIRSAMNEEFVPKFLGANKGKEVFLQHNTQSVKILHDFTDDMLAVIADGTYTRIEKSANNNFQYLSYSKQKLDHLIKPFILCCADGYFIDCYGPFAGNVNDAAILKYILSSDEKLKELLLPSEKIMFFLDRGINIKIIF